MHSAPENHPLYNRFSPRLRGWLTQMQHAFLRAQRERKWTSPAPLPGMESQLPARQQQAALHVETARAAYDALSSGLSAVPGPGIQRLAARAAVAPGYVRLLERDITGAHTPPARRTVTVALLLADEAGAAGVPASLILDMIDDPEATTPADRFFPHPQLAFVELDDAWQRGFLAVVAEFLPLLTASPGHPSIVWKVRRRDAGDFLSLAGESGTGALGLALQHLLQPQGRHPADLSGVALAARLMPGGALRGAGQLHLKLKDALPCIHTVVLAKEQESAFRQQYPLAAGDVLERTRFFFAPDFESARQIISRLPPIGPVAPGRSRTRLWVPAAVLIAALAAAFLLWPRPRTREVIVDDFGWSPNLDSPKPCYADSLLPGGKRDIVCSFEKPFDLTRPWIDVRAASAGQTRFKVKGMTEKHGYVGVWYSIPPGMGRLMAVKVDVSVIDLVSTAARPYPPFIEIECKNEVPAPPPPPGSPPPTGPHKLIRKSLHRATLWSGAASQPQLQLSVALPPLTDEVTKVVILFNKAQIEDSITLDQVRFVFEEP